MAKLPIKRSKQLVALKAATPKVDPKVKRLAEIAEQIKALKAEARELNG